MNSIYIQSVHEAYPDFEHGHMFPCKIKAPADYSKNYEFRVTSKWRKFQRFWIEWILYLFAPIITYFRFAPKYKNKHMLKMHKEELKNGFMTVSNHVFPIAFSFRKPRGLFKLWKGKRPVVNVNVGEPLYADKNLERANAIEDLCKRVHDAVIRLAGFGSTEENESFKKNYKYYPYVNPYLDQYEAYYKKHNK